LACVTIKTQENICAAMSKLFMTVHFQSRWSYLLSTTNNLHWRTYYRKRSITRYYTKLNFTQSLLEPLSF
jgi:hypothetical protein